MVDFNLNDEQLRLQTVAREFVEREVKPVAAERERIDDPMERFPWDLVEKASKLGIRTLAVPKEWGGGGAHTLELSIVGEELAVGDLGIAVIFDQTWKFTKLLFNIANEEQRQRFIPPLVEDHKFLLAMGMTEPGAGSDNILPYPDPKAGLTTYAVRDGSDWVINGMKHFISNGSVAKLYIIAAKTDRSKNVIEGTSAFLVPEGTPGFRIGKVHDKIGQRLINNAELIFEDCRVPLENMLGEENKYFQARRQFTRASNIEAAATTLGVGRAAYEAALEFANSRVQGGTPIIEHQAVGFMIADMALKLELARLIIWKAAWAADNQPVFDPKLAWMAKIYASEASFEVCRLAMEVFGGRGIITDYPVEKYLRDSSTFLHSDGTNQIMRLRIMNSIIHQLRGSTWDVGITPTPAR